MNREEKAELFLQSIVALGKVYGFSLSHEDTQGNFEVIDSCNKTDRWLSKANIIKEGVS